MKYLPEILPPSEDDGRMPENVDDLQKAVVGHRIVKVEKKRIKNPGYTWERTEEAFIIVLDNGKEVLLFNTDDCCAYTELESFLLHPEMVDHVIMGVGTTDLYQTWHIYADYGDILELTVGWSCGNPFYYGYGFDIQVVPHIIDVEGWDVAGELGS